jgi:hypothetical protein
MKKRITFIFGIVLILCVIMLGCDKKKTDERNYQNTDQRLVGVWDPIEPSPRTGSVKKLILHDSGTGYYHSVRQLSYHDNRLFWFTMNNSVLYLNQPRGEGTVSSQYWIISEDTLKISISDLIRNEIFIKVVEKDSILDNEK